MADGYVYDDQQCDARGAGLKHIADGRAVCNYCGRTCYYSKSRGQPAKSTIEPSEGCQFSTCDNPVTIRSFRDVIQSLDIAIVDTEIWPTLLEAIPNVTYDRGVEMWLCIPHDSVVRSAAKRMLLLRRSVEGWIWVDNLDHVRFSA